MNFESIVPTPIIPTTADIIAANTTAKNSAPLSMVINPAAFTIKRNSIIGTNKRTLEIESSSISETLITLYKNVGVCTWPEKQSRNL